MVSLKSLSELLRVLYAAPLDALQWERFLTLVAQHTGSRFGVFICADSGRGLSVHAYGGEVDSSMIQQYNLRYASTDPYRTVVIRQNRTGVFHGDQLVPEEVLLHSELYRDGLMPIGIRYGTMVPLTLSMRRFETVSIWRAPEDGPMHEEGVLLLELLLPHVQQALEIHRVLNVAQQRLTGAEAIADASATAAFLLTRQGLVVHQNAAARSLLLSESATLAMHDGVLTATEPSSRIKLRKFLLATTLSVLSNAQSNPKHALALPRSSGKKPLQLIASPLPLDHPGASQADLLLLIIDPDTPANFPDDVLRGLYGLTPAETEVANGLLMGYTPEEIAGLRHCKVGTVRNQIKSILSKTGTTRQSDLIRLLMTLPQPPATP
jgi:DNA-binding CsgD family transcriptional regulator